MADFSDGVASHLVKCPRPSMMLALKASIIKFCNDSRIWVYDVPEIVVTEASGRNYVMDLPEGAVICYIHNLWGRSEPHDQWSYDMYSGSREPYNYHIDHPDQFVVDSKYIRNHTLDLVVSLKPKQDSLSCPDILLDNYHDAIVSGAVASLQMQPGRSWSEPNMAAQHQAMFMMGVEEAKQKLNQGFGLKQPNYRVRPNFF